MAKNTTKMTVETLTHEGATRKNIPTAEYQSVMAKVMTLLFSAFGTEKISTR